MIKHAYTAWLSDKTTHRGVLVIEVKADGLLTATAEAHKICREHHPELYVAHIKQGYMKNV